MNNQQYRKEYNWYVVDKTYKEVFGPYKSHRDAQHKVNNLSNEHEHNISLYKSHRHPIIKH